MTITVTPTQFDTGAQIGGGAGWVADRLADGIADAKAALTHVNADWNKKPVVGPHPREAALAAAREAAAHITDALGVEAPQDAIDDTRHALEELNRAITELEYLGHRGMPIVPGDRPIGHFDAALRMLEQVETRLRGATWGFG